jgi:pilus assembly protein Flp/PilA
MQKLMDISKRLIKDESGATALEYGLIAGLISLAVVAGATTAGAAVNAIFTTIGTKLNTAATAIAG